MRNFTTMSKLVSKASRSTKYTLARQMGINLTGDPIGGAYDVLDVIDQAQDRKLGLTLHNMA